MKLQQYNKPLPYGDQHTKDLHFTEMNLDDQHPKVKHNTQLGSLYTIAMSPWANLKEVRLVIISSLATFIIINVLF